MSRFSISPIKVDSLSFLILDSPSDKTLPAYIPIFEEHNVTDLVRICEGSPYNTQPLTEIGIRVHDDMKFEDGTAPNKDIIARWLELNDEIFFESPTPDRCIAVHCVSGIGRAPVMVAISLVERGMDPLDAIVYIRKVRRGSLNRVQITFLDGYKKRKKGFGSKKPKSHHQNSRPSSIIIPPPSLQHSTQQQQQRQQRQSVLKNKHLVSGDGAVLVGGEEEINGTCESHGSSRNSRRPSSDLEENRNAPQPTHGLGHGKSVVKKKRGLLSRLFGKK
ncbi:Protein tyrosine phosphatase type IVA 1 [Mortierella claussenii]|nr:Protein tyrosine phosphatase type IVA 1 [Mortierella claussenii]